MARQSRHGQPEWLDHNDERVIEGPIAHPLLPRISILWQHSNIKFQASYFDKVPLQAKSVILSLMQHKELQTHSLRLDFRAFVRRACRIYSSASKSLTVRIAATYNTYPLHKVPPMLLFCVKAWQAFRTDTRKRESQRAEQRILSARTPSFSKWASMGNKDLTEPDLNRSHALSPRSPLLGHYSIFVPLGSIFS